MSVFPQPDIRPIARGKYVLHEAYEVRVDGSDIRVPQRFQHDGASAPRLVWTLSGLRPDGLLRAGALVHDFLYRSGGKLAPGAVKPPRQFSRAEADSVFHRLMVRAGVRPWRAFIAYLAVRLFGGSSWQGSQKH